MLASLEEDEVGLLHDITYAAQLALRPDSDVFEILKQKYVQGVLQEPSPEHAAILQQVADLDGDSLVGRFERIMNSMGVYLEYDDDGEMTRTHSVAPSRAGEQEAATDRLRTPSPPDEDEYLCDTPPRLRAMAEDFDRQKLLGPVLQIWSQRAKETNDLRLADVFYKGVVALKACRHWRQRVARVRDMEAKANEFYELKLCQKYMKPYGESMVEFALHKWFLEYRCRMYQRIRLERNVRAVFQKWLHKVREGMQREAHFEILVQQHRQKYDLRLAAKVFAHVASRVDYERKEEKRAEDVYQRNVATKMLHRWYKKTNSIKGVQQKAAEFRYYYLVKRPLEKWRRKTRERIAVKRKTIDVWKEYVAAETQHRDVLVKNAVTQWRKMTKNSIKAKMNERYKDFRARTKVARAQTVLNVWRIRTARIKDMEKKADEFYNTQSKLIVKDALYKWYDKAMQQRELEELAEKVYDQNLLKRVDFFGKSQALLAKIEHMNRIANQFRHNKDIDLARKVFSKVRLRTFQIQQQERTADEYTERKLDERGRERSTEVFRRMRDAAAARRAIQNGQEPPLALPPVTPAVRRQQQLLELSSTTPAYTPAPAAQSFAARLRSVREQEIGDEVGDGGALR